MIRWRLMLTPWAVTRTASGKKNVLGEWLSVTGYTDCYLFGIRIARIQETKPWE